MSWISIEDQEPPKGEVVLVQTVAGDIRIAGYCAIHLGKHVFSTVPGSVTVYVVAWQPLPPKYLPKYLPAERLKPV